MRKFIKKNLLLFIWLLFIVIILAFAYYLTYYWEFIFFTNFTSNWLATLLGVIIGVPVALWVSRYQEKKTEEENSKRILDALYEELIENIGYLSKWRGDNKEEKIKGTITLSALLKNDLWRAFCDGGEIQWIKNSNDLLGLSAGYSKIVSIKYLADKYLGLYHSGSKKVDPAMLEKIMETLEETVNLAIGILDSLIDWIGVTTEKPEYTTKGNL